MIRSGSVAPLIVHVEEPSMLLAVWREEDGWHAATLSRETRCAHFTAESALAQVTGSWPHEPWLRRIAATAREHATAASSSDFREGRATRKPLPTLVSAMHRLDCETGRNGTAHRELG